MATARASAVRTFEERVTFDYNALIGVIWVGLDGKEQMYYLDLTDDGVELTKPRTGETYTLVPDGHWMKCSCPARGKCKHAVAVAALVERDWI